MRTAVRCSLVGTRTTGARMLQSSIQTVPWLPLTPWKKPSANTPKAKQQKMTHPRNNKGAGLSQTQLLEMYHLLLKCRTTLVSGRIRVESL